MNRQHWYRLSMTCWGIAVVCLGAVTSRPEAGFGNDPPVPATIEDCTFQADWDGSEQRYVVVLPPEFLADQPVSLLIALHGHGSDRWQFVKQSRGECRATRDVALAHRMIMISPDYRASTSWMGPAAEADLLQLIHALKKQFKVQRVLLCGGSMGGTGALTFTALHPDVIDGVVAMNGTADLVEYDRFQDAIAASFGGTKNQVPDEYHQRSAEFFPRRFKMPVATTTGGEDNVVPPESVLRLIARVGEHHSDVLSIHRAKGGHRTTYDDATRALEFVIAASQRRATSPVNE